MSSATKITKTKNGSLKDLKKGDTVTVVGQADSKGVVTATRISEGAGGIGGFGGGVGAAAGGATGAGGGGGRNNQNGATGTTVN